MAVSRFNFRALRLLHPYPSEVPWQLLQTVEPDRTRLEGWIQGGMLRMALLDDTPVAAYILRQQDITNFELLLLVVAPALRRQGLGRWMLGHAVGIAESKGGRNVHVTLPEPQSQMSTLLAGFGFTVAPGSAPGSEAWTLTLMRE